MSGFNSNQQRMRMMYQQNPGQQQVRSLFCHNLTDENVLFIDYKGGIIPETFLNFGFNIQCTLSAKDRGTTKNPVVEFRTNFDASLFYSLASRLLAQY